MLNTSRLSADHSAAVANPLNLLHDQIADPADLTWYVARAATRQERRAEEGLTQARLAFYVPRLTRWHRCGSRKRKVSAPLFEGYFFVGLADGQSLYGLDAIDGVCGVVRFGLEAPRPVSYGPIALTAAAERGGLFDRTGGAEKVFASGEAVRIIGGQFAGYTASFVRLDARDRVSVMVNMFGRASPLQLKASQIEAL